MKVEIVQCVCVCMCRCKQIQELQLQGERVRETVDFLENKGQMGESISAVKSNFTSERAMKS